MEKCECDYDDFNQHEIMNLDKEIDKMSLLFVAYK